MEDYNKQQVLQSSEKAIVHIYTYEAPCSIDNKNTNCCRDYAQFALNNNQIQSFHIYFDRPTLKEFIKENRKNINSKEKLNTFCLIVGTENMKQIFDFLNAVTDDGKCFNEKQVKKKIQEIYEKKKFKMNSLLGIVSPKLKKVYNILIKNLNDIQDKEKSNPYIDVANFIQTILIGLNIDKDTINNGNLIDFYKDTIGQYAKEISNLRLQAAHGIKDRFNFHTLERTENVVNTP